MLPLMGNSMFQNRDLTQNDMNIKALSPEINTVHNFDKNDGEPTMAGAVTDTLNLESLSGLFSLETQG